MIDRNSARPVLLSPWRLRNDSRYVLVYKCVTSEISYRALSTQEAALVLFLNGELIVNELRELWKRVVFTANGDKQDNPDFDKIFAGLGKMPGFIGYDGPISPSLLGDRTGLIPDLSSYEIFRERLLKPLSVNISFTERCQTNCRYCYAERRPVPDMDFNKICELLDELVENEIFVADISGGDLLTRPDAVDILHQMVQRDLVFFLSTKCYISKELAAQLAECGICRKDSPPHLQRTFQLSVDSYDSQIASYLVRSPHYLERTMESVKNLVQNGIIPKIKCVLTAFNCFDPRKMVKLFSDLGITDFQFVQYGRSYYRHNDELFLSLEDKTRLAREFQEIREEFPGLNLMYQNNTTVQTKSNTTWEDWHNRAACSGGRVSMQVKTNGDVTLCDQIPHIPGHVVGNVFEQGILGVWQSQELINFLHPPRSRFKQTACYDCPEFEACHNGKGYCFRDSLFVYGSLFDAPPNCPRQKKSYFRQI
jgi:radical SAM protein with 4Fe4S-binding SPASM domain